MQNVTLADGIVIRDLATHGERADAVRIQHELWGEGFSESVPAAMLMVAQKTGGIAAGAFATNGRLLGFVFGITGVQPGHVPFGSAPHGRLVHWSDLLAVRAEARGRRLGEALKGYQRDRCRELGVETMFWTFDPFVARNAHLNLARLGARIHEFVEDMYGDSTNSRVHVLGTDRFIAAWPVRDDVAPRDLAPASWHGAVVAASGADDCPEPSDPLPQAEAVVVRVPHDHLAVVEQDLHRARTWYLAVRRAFNHYLARGFRVDGFERSARGDGRYLLSRNP